MVRAFISYSRKDIQLVRRLHAALAKGGRDCWVDWEGIPPTAEWLAEIRAAIDNAGALVCVISPDSCASDVCRLELAHAVAQRKRLIPVVCRETPAGAIPPELARLNWIFFRDLDVFDAGVRSIETALDTDLEWVADHTRLLVRAVEWEQAGRDSSFTLRGRDLQRFERWLARAPQEPAPTALQTEYVLESRRAATKRQRLVWISVCAAVAIVAVLSVIAHFQSRERVRQEQFATARQLVNHAEAIRALPVDSPEARGQLRESARVAIRALRIFEELGTAAVEADQALRSAITLLPVPAGEHRLGAGSLAAAAFDPTGHYLAVALASGRLTLWATMAQKPVGACEVGGDGTHQIIAVAASGNGVHAAVSLHPRNAGDAALEVWRIPDCQRVRRTRVTGRHEHLGLDAQGRWVGSLLDGRLTLWDIGTGEPIPTFLDGNRLVSAAAVAPHRTALAVVHGLRGSRERRLAVWQVDGGLPTEWALPETARFVRWTHDGSRLLVGGVRHLHVLDADHGRTIARLPARQLPYTGSAHGTLLAEDIGHGVVEIRDVSDDTVRSRIDHSQELRAMALLGEPDGTTLVTLSAAAEPTVRRWRLASGALAVVDTAAPLDRVWFSADARRVHARGRDTVTTWTLEEDRPGPLGLSATADTHAAVPGEDFRVTIDDGLTAGSSPFVSVTRTGDGVEVARVRFDSKVAAAALADNGRTLAVISGEVTRGGWEADIHVRNLATGAMASARLPGFQDDSFVRLLAVSPTGEYSAVATRRGFTVLDSRTLRPLIELHHPFPRTIAFQAAGPLVATTASERRTRVWHLERRLEVARIIHDIPVTDLALSADGRWLATVTEDGTARVWAVQPEDLIRQACERIGEPCP